MIPLPALLVIAVSYLVFMLLDYWTASYLERQMLLAGFDSKTASSTLKLRVNMVENLVWAVLAWLIGWWVVPLYYATMYPLIIALRLLVSGLSWGMVFVLSFIPEIEAFKQKPLEEQEEFLALLEKAKRLPKIRKARKVPLSAKVAWFVLLSASVCAHLYALPYFIN